MKLLSAPQLKPVDKDAVIEDLKRKLSPHLLPLRSLVKSIICGIGKICI
jgi:hypothetical protein